MQFWKAGAGITILCLIHWLPLAQSPNIKGIQHEHAIATGRIQCQTISSTEATTSGLLLTFALSIFLDNEHSPYSCIEQCEKLLKLERNHAETSWELETTT